MFREFSLFCILRMYRNYHVKIENGISRKLTKLSKHTKTDQKHTFWGQKRFIWYIQYIRKILRIN